MKVGIMSMQRILNYGSFLQALSLKMMIENLGHNVTFVDYQADSCVNAEDFGTFKQRLKTNPVMKKIIKVKHILLKQGAGVYEDVESLYEDPEKKCVFGNSYHFLGIGKEKHYRIKTDVLIIGSDEVFNCLQTNKAVGFSMELFGKRCRAKKLISYAASFGNTTVERLRQYGVDKIVAKYLKKFDSISVRDENSVKTVKELTGRIPQSHLDPVLVGGLENNIEFTKTYEELPEYLVVYGYADRFSESEKKEITEYAKKNGLITVALCENQDFCDRYIRCKPEEILGYFKNSKCVVSDTFHGIIFSVLFHKPLAIYCRQQTYDGYTNEEKILDLTEKLQIKQQLVNRDGMLETVIGNKIDYGKVDKIRIDERKKTMEYLSNMLR